MLLREQKEYASVGVWVLGMVFWMGIYTLRVCM
jgi:hypothetical protein